MIDAVRAIILDRRRTCTADRRSAVALARNGCGADELRALGTASTGPTVVNAAKEAAASGL